MFSAKKSGLLAAFACAALAFAGTANAGVVVKSSGPSAAQYPKGKKLADTARITLKAGDSVTVLDAKGTRVLTGPGTVVVGAEGAPNRAKFAMLTRQRSANRVRTGAVRSGVGELSNPNLWYVDVQKSGKICLPETDVVRFWRASLEGVATYTVAEANGGSMELVFDDGTMVAPWVSEAKPRTDGTAYTITGPGGVPATTVTFADLGGIESDPEGLADALIAHGCDVQLELLANSMAMPQS